jgi:hypothetical protein
VAKLFLTRLSSRHELCLEDVDALVKAIYDTARVNPTFRPLA